MELDHLSHDAPTAGIPGKDRRLEGKDFAIQADGE